MTLRRRLAILPALLSLLALPHPSCAAVLHAGAGANPAPLSKTFPVAPHSNVGIEWWYLNTHVTTSAGRHLAVIASFFRFGQGAGAGGNTTPQSHYLIYAVTDLDAKTHQTYSLADNKSLNLIKQLASLALLAAPNSSQAQSLAAMAGSGKFPPPTQLISGACKVSDSPHFSCVYGNAASVTAVPGEPNVFRMVINGNATPTTSGAPLKLDLTFMPQRIPMYVGGKGLTGVSTPDDMKYVSMTRCDVTGTINIGKGVESVAATSTGVAEPRQMAAVQNIGWFDHQWGSSWTPQNVGWDWWGVQLGSGVDVLFYELVQPGTRKVLQTLATFEYPDGHQVTTRNVQFTPDVTDLWTSAYNGASYPMKWRITFPDQHMWLNVEAAMDDQEMPILGQGKSAIWEGSVNVESGIIPAPNSMIRMLAIPGVGYMELVAYKKQ